jgi:hypothetical protein
MGLIPHSLFLLTPFSLHTVILFLSWLPLYIGLYMHPPATCCLNYYTLLVNLSHIRPFIFCLSVSTHLSYPTVIIIPPIPPYDIIHLVNYFPYSK